MTTTGIILAVLGAVAAAEGALHASVKYLRSSCPWLITAEDERPALDPRGLASFIDHGWDPELGWVRKPDTSGADEGRDGDLAPYHIDGRGARVNPGFEDRAPDILVYGDSYAFARQVNDDQTWAHRLSGLLRCNVANFGVGNYGLDQALMRLEREFDQHPAPVVIMAVVPETMARVHAYWKHYSEYGNTFAFKPRFELKDGVLHLVPNAVDTKEKFNRVSDMLPHLQAHDYFYERKFQRDILGFPYLLSAFKNPHRSFGLLAAAATDRLGWTRDAAFSRVMRRNIKMNRGLYQSDAAVALFDAIAERFRRFCRERNAEPVFVFLPQRMDLERIEAGDHYYAPLCRRLAERMTVIDAAPALRAAPADLPLFVNDKFGGHYSPAGNEIIADYLEPHLAALIAGRGADAENASS